MEDSSDTIIILSSDETQMNLENLNIDSLENSIPLQIMSRRSSEESTCSQEEDQGTTPRNADDNRVSTLSSSSSCCRICQNGESSEHLLENSPCRCKGHLGKAHKKCLMEWVRYKGSNRCEICGAPFADIPPPLRLGVNQIEALEALRWQLERYRPLSRDRRSAMAGLIIFMVLITFVSAIVTVGADRDFRRVTHNPWASRKDQETTHIIFSICVSFLFFTGTLTIGLGMLWLMLECYYATHRRRVIQRAAERMIADSIRDRRLQAENALAREETENAPNDQNHVEATSARNFSESTGELSSEPRGLEIPAGSNIENPATAVDCQNVGELNDNSHACNSSRIVEESINGENLAVANENTLATENVNYACRVTDQVLNVTHQCSSCNNVTEMTVTERTVDPNNSENWQENF